MEIGESQKQQLLQLIMSLIEELIEKHVHDLERKVLADSIQIEIKMRGLCEEIENVQEIVLRHFGKGSHHSRNISQGETEDTVEDLFKRQLNAEIEGISQRLGEMENVETLLMENSHANKVLIRELERKIETFREIVDSRCQENKLEVQNFMKDKLRFQWSVINDQVERIEKFRQKLIDSHGK